MNRSQLAELLRYSSPFSILVVTYKNKIMELKCPFKVELKNDIGNLKAGDIEKVDMVKVSTNLKTVFVVNGVPYYFWHFNIIVF